MPELATLQNVKDWLGVTDTSQDAFLTSLLNRSEGMIEQWCNRPDGWVTGSWTQRFDGEYSEKIVLVNVPVTAVATVKVYTSNSTTLTLDSTTWRSDSESGILAFIDTPKALWDAGNDWPILKNAFPAGFRNGEVIYTGGYASGSIPLDLTQIAIEVAAGLYRSRNRDPAMKSETLGQYSYTLADGAADPFVSIRDRLHQLGHVRKAVL